MVNSLASETWNFTFRVKSNELINLEYELTHHMLEAY